ncbi:hypothetical protein PR003_g12776 [Phytophthora rubi]|uniref:Uncharacterized protein n=1 Tax=Phytophthora rubi TaxID=129364 RepID=A0A6A4F412_9STRA|nr:hypothetical protein PR003_g12776 [Phytophthora rubi]
MHRAEKSSSKICRAREVEKAQELHRRKIDGVKSYLCGIIPKPTASRASASFRPRPPNAMLGSFSSVTCVNGDPPVSAGTSLANSASSGDLEPQQPEKTNDNMAVSETLVLSDDSQKSHIGQQTQALDEFQHSLAKMAEFRGVAHVPGFGSAKHLTGKLAPPPAESRKKSLNASFRARRLKEIKADNAEVFERIRKSVSHYRNGDLQREWQQNLSYLSSISEFPVTADVLASATNIHKQHDDNDSRNCFGPSPRRPSFLKTTTRTEPLPSIPVVAHPIRSIPTSPRKLQLNMTPAFRSLRKAMPQQPSLPPISSPHTVINAGGPTDFGSNVNNEVLSSPRGRSTCPNSPGIDDRFTESTMGRHRSSTAVAATKFIGDLHGRQAESEMSGDAKYQLLKTGRFVGGTYLVLTVFCGDGVTNPYGFDVFAYQRELQCEYKLSITKEMTHELLDKSSSSSLAAETAAAAGTNLSMQEIARSICDHINFALLGADQGEMIFLAPTVARKSDQAMRFDASPGLVAFCVHQTVELETFLQLDVDLFGNEIIVFPVLEHAVSSVSPSDTRQTSDNDDGLATSSREFLSRGTSWEDENISEGDEGADNDEYDNDELSTGIHAYDTDDEEDQDEAEGSYSSYANQDEADQDFIANVVVDEDTKLQHSECNDEETPERDEDASTERDAGEETLNDVQVEPTTRRPWRQGRKIDGRFCLLRGSPDDKKLATSAMSIAALGQLETLSTPTHIRIS